MANTGWTNPTTVSTYSDTPYDDIAWNNTTNVYSSNNSYASALGLGLEFNLPYTHWLLIKGFNFSAIPTGATINGVVCRVEAYSTDNTFVQFARLQLLSQTGFPTGSYRGMGTAITTTETYHTFGGSTDTWGNTLTEAWVKDADFGVGIVIYGDWEDDDVYIDHVQLDVYYTEAASTVYPKVNVGGAWKTVTRVQVNVGGTWKDVSEIKTNVGGAWKSLV